MRFFKDSPENSRLAKSIEIDENQFVLIEQSNDTRFYGFNRTSRVSTLITQEALNDYTLAAYKVYYKAAKEANYPRVEETALETTAEYCRKAEVVVKAIVRRNIQEMIG